jgi:hypothetical protein
VNSVSSTTNPNQWEERKRFSDGDIALVVMRQEPPPGTNHLPRFSYRIGRANGEHISPHIPVFARPDGKKVNITFPSPRIDKLIRDAEEWIREELLRFK